MNTERINREIDLAMEKLIKKEILDLPRTLQRLDGKTKTNAVILTEGDTIEEKAWFSTI
ncbi:hypothetical protein [Planococcus sp. ISL-109]|uniref:hypothetical protein n=1 Tax=Planococcus sp. ISL-109 TaxID=2819166 RepID=UPI001BE566A0|nr:hypothetical protein [Planococcus sp. ISL-109]MBT2584211.1 hypothetical protein [Planococcus sp. ISL-109]